MKITKSDEVIKTRYAVSDPCCVEMGTMNVMYDEDDKIRMAVSTGMQIINFCPFCGTELSCTLD